MSRLGISLTPNTTLKEVLESIHDAVNKAHNAGFIEGVNTTLQAFEDLAKQVRGGSPETEATESLVVERSKE